MCENITKLFSTITINYPKINGKKLLKEYAASNCFNFEKLFKLYLSQIITSLSGRPGGGHFDYLKSSPLGI